MVKHILVAAAAGLMLSAISAQAAPIINVPNVDLLPNQAGQIVDLSVSGGGSVTGFNLNAQIGTTGASPTPIFSAVNYNVGIWAGQADTVMGGPIAGSQQYVQSSVVLNTSGATVSASGELVELTISTVGISSGSFPLMLAGTAIGEDSAFIGTGGSNIPATITNGSIMINVPEPATLLPLLLGTGAILRRRRQ